LEECKRIGFSEYNIRRYHKLRINILNFLHRLGYSLLLSLAFFVIFKQKRPCSCPNEGAMRSIGSKYGMPSSESLTAGLFGSLIIDHAPYCWPIITRIVGVVLIFWASGSVLVVGQNSMGQVIVGVLMGIILYFYSTRVPQCMIFVDAALESIAAIIAVRLDDTHYNPNDPDNLNAWLFWGLGVEFFTCAMVFRHYKSYDTLPHLKMSLRRINEDVYSSKGDMSDDESEFDSIMDEAIVDTSFTKVSDSLFMLPSLVLMLTLFLISNCVQEYGWLS